MEDSQMPSSKLPLEDGVWVPAVIMSLFRCQANAFVNPPIEQRTTRLLSRGYGDRIFVDETMRQFLKDLALPTWILLHFRGYGKERGTVAVRLRNIYWTAREEEYPRLDFDHPVGMEQTNSCPNLWGAFVLAIAPLEGEHSPFWSPDPDGREFVRIYMQKMKAAS